MQFEEMTKILEIGMKAVSTGNNQPWRFRFHNEMLDIFMLRTKNFFLKLEGNTWIELGTVIENISVAAAAQGYRIEYQIFERCGLDEPAAILKFFADKLPAVDVEPLLRRCTNRKPFSDKPLPKSIQEDIAKDCNFPDIATQILTGERKIQCEEILNNLENLRLNNIVMVEEIMPYLRIDPKEIEISRDRLDIRTMELHPRSQRFIRLAKNNPKYEIGTQPIKY